MIDQHHRYLASIPGVNHSWRIDYSNTEFPGVTTSWQNQSSPSGGNRNRESRTYRGALPRPKRKIDSRVKIDRSVADMCIRGNWEFQIESFEGNLHLFTGLRAEDLSVSVIEDGR
jgi:hypothetical protein